MKTENIQVNIGIGKDGRITKQDESKKIGRKTTKTYNSRCSK